MASIPNPVGTNARPDEADSNNGKWKGLNTNKSHNKELKTEMMNGMKRRTEEGMTGDDRGYIYI